MEEGTGELTRNPKRKSRLTTEPQRKSRSHEGTFSLIKGDQRNLKKVTEGVGAADKEESLVKSSRLGFY